MGKVITKKNSIYSPFKENNRIINEELIITDYGCSVNKKEDGLTVKQNHRLLFSLPFEKISALYLLEKSVNLSTDVISECVERGIPIFLINNTGQVIAHILKLYEFFSEMTLIQIKEREQKKGLYLAKMFVLGKVKNQYSLLKRYYKYNALKNHDFGGSFCKLRKELESIILKIKNLRFENNSDEYRMQLFGLDGFLLLTTGA